MNTTADLLHLVREPALMPWGMQFFFLIEISIATFFLSLPGLVWRYPDWRRVSWNALLAALVCGLSAPLVLLIDLQQPGRVLSLYLQPDSDSWLAWGVLFVPLYLFGLLLYSWLCLRSLFGKLAFYSETGRYLKLFYRALAYGGHDNLNAIRVAAIVAVLGALLVQLYTGMELMATSAAISWHGALQVLLLMVSSLVGGLGIIGVFDAIAITRPEASLLNRWLERSLWLMLALLIAAATIAPTGSTGDAGQALAFLRGAHGWPFTLIGMAGIVVLTLWLIHRFRRSLVVPAVLSVQGAWIVRWTIFVEASRLSDMVAILRTDFVSVALNTGLSIIATAALCLTLYLTLTCVIPWNDPMERSGG